MARKNVSLNYFLQNKMTVKVLSKIFLERVEVVKNQNYKAKLSKAFYFALNNDPSLFKSQSVDVDNAINEAFKEYIDKWISLYVRDRTSCSLNKPLKTYGERDDALITRVASSSNVEDTVLEDYIKGHYIYMSAENLNGSILEEYLAKVLEPIGWIWCAGSIFKAIDFLFISKDHNILLQVKNKYNTENSSSSKIRKDTTIIKWNRLNRPQRKFDPFKPLPNWDDLINQLGIQDKGIISSLSEEAYLQYIRENSANSIDEL